MKTNYGSRGFFTYLDDGGGPKEDWEWCCRESNSTGNTPGLGIPFILNDASKPFNMDVYPILGCGRIFGYSGTWLLYHNN